MDRARHVVPSDKDGASCRGHAAWVRAVSSATSGLQPDGGNVRCEALEEFCFNGEQTFWQIAGVELWGTSSSYGNGQGRTGLTTAKGENHCWVRAGF